MTRRLIPIGALTLALSLSGAVAQADQHQRENRGSTRSEGHARQRSESRDSRNNSARDSQNNSGRGNRNDSASRDEQRSAGPAREERQAPRTQRDEGRNTDRGFAVPRSDRFGRGDDRRADGFRGYVAPRPRFDVRRPSLNHRYGPGFSVFFGIGNGYRYGSPYSGRVYGYVPRAVYGARIYYGDVRLQVRPRDAAVFVDGYYAGIVDDFDGFFQRLTLTVGPHEIEIEAPGFEPQVFNVFVDSSRTVDVHADLYPDYR
jgi:hypothetical protein